MEESWPFPSEKTLQALNEFLPPHWSHNNPIDILGDADSERYAKALEIAANDPDSDGLLVILAPQGMTDPAAIAEALKPYAKSSGKPVLTSWMGGASIASAVATSMPPASHIFLSRHGRPGIHLHVALQPQPARTLRDAVTGGGPANSTHLPAARRKASSRPPATRAGCC